MFIIKYNTIKAKVACNILSVWQLFIGVHQVLGPESGENKGHRTDPARPWLSLQPGGGRDRAAAGHAEGL